MVIKVCGIKTKENIDLLAQLNVEMIGLNFYPPSARYIDPVIGIDHFSILPKEMKRVGVFVNESLENINEIASKYNLDYIQLHGDEDVNFCKSVAKYHKIIKVFRVDDQTDFHNISEYSFANYYLFDTATKHFGGSGKKFDWSVLEDYKGNTPFLLSGGIGPDDADAVLQYDHPMYLGIDINSKFESEPAVKNPELISPFIHKLRK